jgi:hypothetical protein
MVRHRSCLAYGARAALLALCVAISAALPAAAQTDRFDNFRMRKAVPTQLKQVAPDLYFLYDDISSNSAFLVTDEGVLVIDTRQKEVKAAIAAGMSKDEMVATLRFPQYASLRNYDRISVFIEALHHLYTTGKPLFPYLVRTRT